MTQNCQLVSGSQTEIFYQKTKDFFIPAILDDQLAFLHPGITVDDFRDGPRELLGLKEYSEENLLRVAVRVFKRISDLQVPGNQAIALEIIRFVQRLKLEKAETLARISDDLLFPVINLATQVRSWKNLLQSPVYFKDFVYAAEYNGDYDHIDTELIVTAGDPDGWAYFLSKLGVWQIPGVSIHKARKAAGGDPQRYLVNDRELHQPSADISGAFSWQLISSWSSYHDFITATLVADLALRIEGDRQTD